MTTLPRHSPPHSTSRRPSNTTARRAILPLHGPFACHDVLHSASSLLHRSRAPLHGIMLRVELRINEPPFSQAASRCCAESACCKRMFQVFQMFQRYVSSVSYGCCKSRSGYHICCNGCTRMLQAYVPNVSSIFRRCCNCVYLDAAYVLDIYCKCFILDITYVCNDFQVYSGVFANALDTRFKCFIWLPLYVASVASKCFKSRTGAPNSMPVGSGGRKRSSRG